MSLADPLYPYVTLLLPFTEGVGAVAFSDASPLKRTIAAAGSVVGAAANVNGVSSALFTIGVLTVTETAATLLPGDATIEAWINTNSFGAFSQGLVYLPSSTAPYLLIQATSGNTISVSGTRLATSLSSAVGALTANSWHHIAVTRSGVIGKLWFDGVLVDTQPFTSGNLLSVGTSTIGNTNVAPASGSSLRGYYGGLRITATCRYFVNFNTNLPYVFATSASAFDYSSLLTSEHAYQPKLVAWLNALTTDSLGAIATTLLSIPGLFDVDVAIGDQLDKVGLWAGISRIQPAPNTLTFFSWNVVGLGWNAANWRGPFEPVYTHVTLDDATYRAIIKAKIGGNYWVGTSEGAQAIGAEAAAGLGVTCYVLDNLDMTVTVYIVGTPSAYLLQMIKNGLIPPKAAGVRLASYKIGASTTTIPELAAPKAPVTFGNIVAL